MAQNSRNFLAFDLGAGSGRAVLGTLADGILSLKEIHRFPNQILEVNGKLHWDIFSLYEEMLKSLRDCAGSENIQLDSMGIDTWGVDFALLGEDGKILGLPFSYRDKRSEGIAQKLFNVLPLERILDLTGIQFLPFNTIFQLYSMSLKKDPFLETARNLLFIPDFLNYLFTGIKKTEFTFATTSQLFNPKTGNWENEIFSAINIPVSLMQEVVQPGTVLGPVTDDVRKATGLTGLNVVLPATHDTGSAVVSVPMEDNCSAYISSGTWSLMGMEVESPVINEKAMALNFTNEGGVSGTFRLLKNIMGLWILEECRRSWGDESNYDDLLTAADESEPFRSLICPDSEEFFNPPDMVQQIEKSCRSASEKIPENKAQFTRCILESLALRYRSVLDELRQVQDKPIKRIHIVGGGAKNSFLCRLTANATGLPVLAGPTEATAIGNIMVQALASGCVKSLGEIRSVVRNSFKPTIYEPEPSADWDRAYERFLNLA